MVNREASERLLFDEWLEKARRFCAYRDRCKKETADRLQQLGASKEVTRKILEILQKENFIDEQRFASAFVRGKFKHNHWGRVRLKQELSVRQISEKSIAEALIEIDEEDYQQALKSLASKKLKSLKGQPDFAARGKTAAYCIGKGYEADLVWKMINEL